MSALAGEATKARFSNTRIGYLAAVEKYKEAALVADLLAQDGAYCRAMLDGERSGCLLFMGEMAAAAHAACSALRAARASNGTGLVTALLACGNVALKAPDEMVKAETESRKHEPHSGSSSYDGLDLSRIILPTTPAALFRLSLAYREAAIAICDMMLADSPTDNGERRVPLRLEANVRGDLGASLYKLGGDRQRSFELFRQAVALLRQQMRTAPGVDPEAVRSLAAWLGYLASVLNDEGPDQYAEAEACLREALKLSKETDDVLVKQIALRDLANLSCRPDQPMGFSEAAALRSRLNTLSAQNGRTTDTNCTICLEPLEQPAGAEQDAVSGGREAAVRVMSCYHQFHLHCLSTWQHTTSNTACPICKQG